MSLFFKPATLLYFLFLLFSGLSVGFSQETQSVSSQQMPDTSSKGSLKGIYNAKNPRENKKFSITFNYDFAFFHFVDKYGEGRNYYGTNQHGWGMAFEYFPTASLSLYTSFSDTYSVPGKTKKHYDMVYFGVRGYFSFLYVGIGSAFLARSIVETSVSPYPLWWGMYLQTGGDFPVSKNISIDTGVSILIDGKGFTAYTRVRSRGDFYFGIKYMY